MNKTFQLNGPLRMALAGTVTFLTILSPLCAPLCAATSCHSASVAANSGQDGCHHALASSANTNVAIAAPQLCNLKELPAATLSDSKVRHQQNASRFPVLDSHTLSLVSKSQYRDLNQRQWPGSSPSFHDKPAATTILRI